MADCPKCGKHLRMLDWRQTCPYCDVNLVYYKSNEKLLDDSEKAEIEHAHTQPKVDRAKAAYFGSPLSIARFVLTILPVVTLLVPFAKFSGANGSKLINLVSVVNFFRAGGFNKMLGALPGNKSALALALMCAAAAMFLINAIFLIASYGKHGKGRQTALYAFTFLLAIASFICLLAGGKDIGVFIQNYSSAVPFIGAVVFLIVEFAALAVNVLLYAKGVKVRYTPCLIGGLPKEEYYSYVEQGMTREEIRRKMLVALAGMQEEFDKKVAEEEAHKRGGE
ncbi:MAG: hypothetical protein IJK60_08695 [Clostridia bacterium]|nr:hypothetical protein [Clostridia bacterium]